MEDVAPAAFTAGLLRSLPHMIDRREPGRRDPRPGIVNHLSHLFGTGCFDEGKERSRLSTFVTNIRSPLVRDFTRNWKALRQELTRCRRTRHSREVSIQGKYTSRGDDSTRYDHVQSLQKAAARHHHRERKQKVKGHQRTL